MASSRTAPAPTFARRYPSGSATDSEAIDRAARWITQSIDLVVNASRSRSGSWIAPGTKRANGGTAARCPVERSSSAIAECRARTSSSVTMLPM